MHYDGIFSELFLGVTWDQDKHIIMPKENYSQERLVKCQKIGIIS